MAGPSLGNIVFLLAAVLGGSFQPQPVLAVSTDKSLETFGGCFSAAQDRAGHAWAFIASDRGGSFTNEGAEGVSAAYRLQIHEQGAGNELMLFADSGSRSGALVKAVNQCR